MNVRPHPGPLPQERENRRPLSRKPTALHAVMRFAATEPGVAIATKPNEFSSDVAPLTLSSGERAGVRASVGLIALLLFTAALVHAQSYSIDWSTIDGGGGTSTGGVYSVSGTIGQSDAGGPMTGGQYSVTGGFCALYAVQTPGAPLLTITYAGNQAIVSWPPSVTGWTLQTNVNLATGTWGNYAGAVVNNRVTNAPPTGNLFFRLKNP